MASAASQPALPDLPAPARPPRSLSRPPPKVNINIEAILQSTPRKRGTGGLALQARDSVAIRKRTMSAGAMSARVARHNARKANAELLQPKTSSGSSPLPPRSPSPSPSSPSQSPMLLTSAQPSLSGGPSAYRQVSRTHATHDSQGTSTSAYPPSSSMSTRSSSPSPDRSRTPSPLPLPKTPSVHNAPITTSLELDPDDVNARLRLLVNNSYFLPPAHAKPELSPIRPPTGDIKVATSPSPFKEFFRVGKKKAKKASEPSGYASEGAQNKPRGRLLRRPSDETPLPLSRHCSDGRFGPMRCDIPSPEERTRNRVVVVRETVEVLPSPLPRVPFRPHEHNSMDTVYNDPTTHYDVPPPTHFPSFADLRIDAAGITGNVQVDQFVPPGEPWSPTPSSPNGSGMDPQERVWRRAILEQAVDLSLSSGSEAGLPDVSFTRGARMNSEDSAVLSSSILGMVSPVSPIGPKNKRSWWGRKDRGAEDAQGRPSISTSSLTDRNRPRNSGSVRSARSLDVDAHSRSSLRIKQEAMIGRRILPNVHAELEVFEREQALREKEANAGLPPPLRPKPTGQPGMTFASAPVSPLSDNDSSDPASTKLHPPPHRKGEKRRTASDDDVSREFVTGHSTIRKTLSSPLLSDLHETGVDVDKRVTYLSDSNDSFSGVAPPSFVLQDPSGASSLVHSNTADSFSSGSHYEDTEFDGVMNPAGFPEDNSFEHWNGLDSSPFHGNGRPSLDSFGAERVRSPDFHPRASSTFGFRRSPAPVVPPAPLWEPAQGFEVDITGDPTEHLSMLERSSPTPTSDSHTSSPRGYVSALDHTLSRSPSFGRPPSPSTASLHSNATTTPANDTVSDQNDPGVESEAPIAFFDTIQHETYMEGDYDSSDSEEDAPPQPDPSLTSFSEHPAAQSSTAFSERLDEQSLAASERPIDHSFTTFSEHPPDLPLARKSLSSVRPTPAFTIQFRNASQPHLPVTRGDALPPIDTTFPRIMPYNMLDPKKPLSNMPLSAPMTMSGGILSQLKGKRSKSPTRQLLGLGKKRSGTSPVVIPESTFESLRYPPGTAFSSSSAAGTGTPIGSERGSVEAVSRGFDGALSQRSLLSMGSGETASLRHAASFQDESVRKLDGMVMQHLEAEKDRLRKIASAAKLHGGGRARDRN